MGTARQRAWLAGCPRIPALTPSARLHHRPLQYYDDAAGILRMVILSAVQPHRLLAAPLQPLPQHSCGGSDSEGGMGPEGSQHGMQYAMSHMSHLSMDDMRSQVADEDRCLGCRVCALASAGVPPCQAGVWQQQSWDASTAPPPPALWLRLLSAPLPTHPPSLPSTAPAPMASCAVCWL